MAKTMITLGDGHYPTRDSLIVRDDIITDPRDRDYILSRGRDINLLHWLKNLLITVELRLSKLRVIRPNTELTHKATYLRILRRGYHTLEIFEREKRWLTESEINQLEKYRQKLETTLIRRSEEVGYNDNEGLYLPGEDVDNDFPLIRD